jgi:hypothetical protein
MGGMLVRALLRSRALAVENAEREKSDRERLAL